MKTKWITNPENIDKPHILSEVNSGNFIIIQFDEIIYSDKTLSDLNDLARILNYNLQIRFYGHDKQTFDCVTLLKVNNVKNLSINCLKKVKNLNNLSKLEHLEKLIIGIDDFKETEILNSDNLKSLIELNLDKNNNKSFNLEYLKTFNKLKSLAISGNFKNTESIGKVENLETLYLGSISNKISLGFVNQLKKLTELHISFGSRENIDEIIGENLEVLTILWIKKLKSIDNLSRFKNLKSLEIKNQAQIKVVDFNDKMNYLEKLSINNCKNIDNLTGLKNLTSLKTLGILRSPKLSFDNIVDRNLPSTLEHFNFYSERKTYDKEIKERIRNLGYKTT